MFLVYVNFGTHMSFPALRWLLDRILALPSVKAIVWANLPSQESGNSLVDILWGDVNPSGKLAYTIAKQASDYNTEVAPGDDDYSEGLYIDYRYFNDRARISKVNLITCRAGDMVPYVKWLLPAMHISTVKMEV
ncbi:glycosyl hydrolase family 3 C-terminal domain-containing protein [Stachybotrys elegans]|uniref:beta-glucosidase n=1 Tax=Stachybotrys elegans TaxID=80388 RepID=A0A8K0WVX1_9HYPO|nr:glycosyl hydrolase family 3 C-terminal domain-containing protein [Stachybotrys elegans]